MAIAFTLIETAKLNKVDPQAWLTWILDRIAAAAAIVDLRQRQQPSDLVCVRRPPCQAPQRSPVKIQP